MDHGAALVEQVIRAVNADVSGDLLYYSDHEYTGLGPWVKSPRRPMPQALLDEATFPSGRPLPPSLRRWLAFDTAMLREYGWLGAGYRLTPRTLGELTWHRYHEDFFEQSPMAQRFTECFLLPGGSDSCRVLVTDSVDDLGEYPILALDIDDAPYAELMYPGFDVFLADNAGLVTPPPDDGCSALAEDPRFAARMAEHARQCFAGSLHEDCWGSRR